MKRIIITAAAALAVAACSSGGDFEHEFNEATRPMEALLDAPNPPLSDVAAYEARMTKLADGLDDVGDKMERVYAPKGHEQELARFVEELHASADGARDLGKALHARDPERVSDAYSEYLRRLQQAGTTEALLEQASG